VFAWALRTGRAASVPAFPLAWSPPGPNPSYRDLLSPLHYNYAYLQLSKSSVIQKLTVLGLKSSHEHRHGVKTGCVAWSDIVIDTETVVVQYFGEAPHGTKYVVGMSFVGPSGLALVKQDFMHRITFHDAGHMKDAGHVLYGGEGKLESRPTVTRSSLGCLILVRSLM